MLYRQFFDDKLAQYSYLIGCQATGEAVVIDPERDIDRYVEAAEAESLEIVAVADTHIHADYVTGAREFAERYGTKLYLSDEGDEDWEGNEGVVTTLLVDLEVDTENGVAVVCGPPIMMKFTAQKLLDYYDPESIYLSLEKNMSCGIGMCGHCQLGKYYVCKDGPVFTYDQVIDIPDLWE